MSVHQIEVGWRLRLLTVGCQYYLFISVCLQDFLNQIAYLYLLILNEAIKHSHIIRLK